jgi:hypothetical protein
MPLSRIKSKMEVSQLRLDSSAASTDVDERVLLDGTDASDTDDGYAVILEDATANALDGGPLRFSEVPISVATPAFRVHLAVDTTISDNTHTKIPLNAVQYDVGGYFDNATNYRFTPLIAGYYHITLSAGSSGSGDFDDNITQIYKNGVRESMTRIHLTGLTNDDLTGSVIGVTDVIHMNGTTDYLEGYIKLDSEDAASPVIDSGIYHTWMAGHLLTRTS